MPTTASHDAAQNPSAFATGSLFQTGRDLEHSFRRIFEAHGQPLRRFFARKGLPPEVCRDLTQETFLCVFRGLATYRPQARFETWLYHIANTTYLKHLRSRTTAKRAGEEVSIERLAKTKSRLGVSGPQLDRMLAGEQRRALRRAVRALPERMRRCVELKIYRELRYREVADTLKVSIGTVKTHLYKARGRLRQQLAANDRIRPCPARR